jgi:mutator protein MutT
MADRFVARSAVFVAALQGGKVLLHRRCNTGYMDGRYDLPSGHVERGEALLDAATRELQEETGLTAKPTDLKLWHINQFSANNQEYYNFFFIAGTWQGEPVIMEHDKCDDMGFFPLEHLPKLTPGSQVALADIHEHKVTFGLIDQSLFDKLSKN